MARQPKSEKRQILTRTEKWPLRLSPEQETLILQISDGLREYYSWALQREQEAYTAYKAAKEADPSQKPNVKGFLNEIDLYNLYKTLRQSDEQAGLWRAKIPANWVLETFRAVAGSYKSFFALVSRGDKDARPPQPVPEWLFQAIPGALSPSSVKAGVVTLAPTIYPGLLQFTAPDYQKRQLDRSLRAAKFVIKRADRNLRERSYFTLSVSYEIDRPEQQPFNPKEAVFIALGATSIGVVSPYGKEVVRLWRPDKHWKPIADVLRQKLKQPDRTQVQLRAIQRDLRIVSALMAHQQTLDRREVVSQLLRKESTKALTKNERRHYRRHSGESIHRKVVSSGHGVHFVVTELVVRSKEGKLADASKAERGGTLGANWSAQNTGALAYLVSQLKNKAQEHGGTVRRLRVDASFLSGSEGEDEKKLMIAEALRAQFLATPEKATVL